MHRLALSLIVAGAWLIACAPLSQRVPGCAPGGGVSVATSPAAAGVTPPSTAAPPPAATRAAFGGGDWEWESRGVGGGGTFIAAAINPHDPFDLAVSTDMGMAFRSSDFGQSWFALHFEALRGTDRAVLKWTADPKVVYSIDWRGYSGSFPVRSGNGGRGWTRLANDPSSGEAWAIDVDPSRTDRVLLAGWRTLWLSTDGAQTWRSIAEAANAEAGIALVGVVWAGDRIVVATADTWLYSADGGASFEARPYRGLPADHVVGSLTGASDGDTLRLWAVSRAEGSVWPGIRPDQWAGYRGVWTTDVGRDDAFRSLTGGVPSRFFAVQLGAARNNLDVVYASGADTELHMPGVLRSTDAGRSWEAVFHAPNNRNVFTGWCGARGDIDFWWSATPSTFAVSPSDPAVLMFGDYGFVHVSGDGGATWRQAYVDVADQNPAGSPTPKGRAYAGIGLEDTSAWWLHWINERTLFAAFSDIRGIRSTDGGQKWVTGVALGLPHNTTYHVVEHPQTHTLYAATASVHDMYQSTYLTDELISVGEGSILQSNDGGATWSTLRNMGKSVVWLALHPTDPNTLYAAVADHASGGIYVTNTLNAGEASTWRRLASPQRTQGHPYNVHVLADGTIVSTWSGRRDAAGAFTTSSGVFVSTNDGQSWIDRSHDDMRRWTKDVVIDPHDPTQNTWYVGVFSHWGHDPNEVGGLFRTRDRGVTWQRISSLYRVESVTIDPHDPNLMFVTTETQGLWASEDAAAESPTFRPVLTYPFEHPTRVFFNPHNTDEVWAASFGGGLRVWNRSDGNGGRRRPALANAPPSSPPPPDAPALADGSGSDGPAADGSAADATIAGSREASGSGDGVPAGAAAQ